MAYPAVQAFAQPGYQNVYIPGYSGDGEARNNLLVGFPFNEDAWSLANYTTVIGRDKPKAYYARWYNPDFARRPYTDSKDRRWADGAERPKATPGARFIWQQYEMLRFGDSTFVGELAEEFSDIGSLVKLNQETMAGWAMIDRTNQTQTQLTTSGNWQTTPTHFYAKYGVLATNAATLGYSAGYFGVAGTDHLANGTVNDPYIKKVLSHACIIISKTTNGRITPKDLVLVMNPTTAARLSQSQEIRAYLSQQAGSLAVLEGKDPAFWPNHGLPNPLYGIKVVVDYTPLVSTKQSNVNEDTQSFAVPDGAFEILARPGGVAGMNGGRSFSTVVIFQHDKNAMKPTTIPDPRSRRIEVAFEDFYAPVVVAPETGFVIQDVFNIATS